MVRLYVESWLSRCVSQYYRNICVKSVKAKCHKWHFALLFASFHATICVKSQCVLPYFTRWNAANHFTIKYQHYRHPQLTPKWPPPFPWLTTPLSLRRTIGRCSWSLRNEESKGLGERLCMPYTISPLIINNVTLTIGSPRNSVRVVLLIARGWRGTSLLRVNVRKEIQRRRCCAFSLKARLQWNLLWRINPKKRNTYGVVPRTTYANPG